MGSHNVESRRALLKQGKALPPKPGKNVPRFPIDDVSDLESAIHLARTPQERRHCYKHARRLGKLGKIPASWRPNGTKRDE